MLLWPSFLSFFGHFSLQIGKTLKCVKKNSHANFLICIILVIEEKQSKNFSYVHPVFQKLILFPESFVSRIVKKWMTRSYEGPQYGGLYFMPDTDKSEKYKGTFVHMGVLESPSYIFTHFLKAPKMFAQVFSKTTHLSERGKIIHNR